MSGAHGPAKSGTRTYDKKIMARILGATWTHYTPCSDAHWRAGARTLLSRHRL